MDYDEAVAHLAGLQRFGIRPGLARMWAILDELGNPHERWPSIHVAGTNGKGSVTAYCAAILHAAGLRVGRYHSPYVFDLRERIIVNDVMIPRERFSALMTRIVPIAERIATDELGPVTEFEMKTCVGFKHFADEAVDAACIETGLGGRLDATNVILPRVSVVTNIGLDHTAILGETHRQIAREKGGIIKPGSRLVTAAQEPDALEVLAALGREMMAGMTHVRHASTQPSVPGRSVVWWEENESLTVHTPVMDLKRLEVGMLGAHQRENAAVAIAAVEGFAASLELDIPMEAYAEGVRTACLPGRMQIVSHNPTVVLDGAHNREAAGTVRRAISELVGDGKLYLVIGMSKGHDAGPFLAALTPVSGSLILTQPSSDRRLPLESLQAAADDLELTYTVADTVSGAVDAARNLAGPKDTILVTGSFFTVGDCAALGTIAADPMRTQCYTPPEGNA